LNVQLKFPILFVVDIEITSPKNKTTPPPPPPPPPASLNSPLPRNDYKHFSPSSSLPIRYWQSRLRNCRRERSHSSSVRLARFLGMASSLGWARMVRMVGVCLLRAGFGGRWERCKELAWAVSGRWRRIVGARSFLHHPICRQMGSSSARGASNTSSPSRPKIDSYKSLNSSSSPPTISPT